MWETGPRHHAKWVVDIKCVEGSVPRLPHFPIRATGFWRIWWLPSQLFVGWSMGEARARAWASPVLGAKERSLAPVERWTTGPLGNSLWRDHNSYLLCRAGNGALRGHLLFMFWSVTGPGHTYVSHSCKKSIKNTVVSTFPSPMFLQHSWSWASLV